MKTLKIAKFYGMVTLADKISNLILKATLKYTNHSSTVATKNLKNAVVFSFSNVSIDVVITSKYSILLCLISEIIYLR